VGEETAAPARSERVWTDAGRVEPGGAPAFPQRLVEPVAGKDRLVVAGDSSAAFKGCQSARFSHSAAVFLRRAASGTPRSRDMSAISRSQSVWEPTNQNCDSARFITAYFCRSVITISTGHGISSQRARKR